MGARALRVLALVAVFATSAAHAKRTNSSSLQECAPGTSWDGFSCAHPPATCGGWDGVSCDGQLDAAPLAPEAQLEVARFENETRAVCRRDVASQNSSFVGTPVEIINAYDAAFARVHAFDEDFERLRSATSPPRWVARNFAALARLYDCLWDGLRQSAPSSLFTPQQSALLAKLQQLGGGSVQDIIDAVVAKWRTARDDRLEAAVRRAVTNDVTAYIIAKQHAIGDNAIEEARSRLRVIAAVVGDAAMSDIVGSVLDPSDPSPNPRKHRHVRYFLGAFGTGP